MTTLNDNHPQDASCLRSLVVRFLFSTIIACSCKQFSHIVNKLIWHYPTNIRSTKLKRVLSLCSKDRLLFVLSSTSKLKSNREELGKKYNLLQTRKSTITDGVILKNFPYFFSIHRYCEINPRIYIILLFN